MVESYILKINESLDYKQFSVLLQYVTCEKKQKINKFYRFEDAERSLLGDTLARYALCKRLGFRNDHLVFSCNAYGKPILPIQYGTHFNISHSGNFVVCAVDDAPVGIDVEKIKNIDLDIAKRFFSKKEYSALISLPKELQTKYFYKIWVLKESYIKAEGMGLSIPLNSFSLIDFQNMPHEFIGYKTNGYYFYQYSLDDETEFSICTIATQQPFNILLNKAQFLTQIVSVL